MTVELQMLVYTAVLSVVLAFPPLFALIAERGVAYAGGNRDGNDALSGWGGRAQRAQWNLLANLPAFTVLVLAAAVAGISNENTAFAAQQFFWARVAHALLYVAGVPYLRAVAFLVSMGALFDLTLGLLRA